MLQTLSFAGDEQLQLVNQMIVEEVLQDLGVLDFGKGDHGQGERCALALAW